jgi:hypothetical protein
LCADNSETALTAGDAAARDGNSVHGNAVKWRLIALCIHNLLQYASGRIA